VSRYRLMVIRIRNATSSSVHWSLSYAQVSGSRGQVSAEPVQNVLLGVLPCAATLALFSTEKL